MTDPLIIAVTGNCQDEDRIRYHEAGFSAQLLNPVDAQELQQTFDA